MAYLKFISFLVPPLIAFLIYVYLRYKFTKWSFSLLFKSFLWGMVSIFLVLLVQVAANYLELDKLNNIRRILFWMGKAGSCESCEFHKVNQNENRHAHHSVCRTHIKPFICHYFRHSIQAF